MVAAAGTLTDPRPALAGEGGDAYCADGCGFTAVCDPHGGTCDPSLCYAAEQYWTYVIICNGRAD